MWVLGLELVSSCHASTLPNELSLKSSGYFSFPSTVNWISWRYSGNWACCPHQLSGNSSGVLGKGLLSKFILAKVMHLNQNPLLPPISGSLAVEAWVFVLCEKLPWAHPSAENCKHAVLSALSAPHHPFNVRQSMNCKHVLRLEGCLETSDWRAGPEEKRSWTENELLNNLAWIGKSIP